MNLRNTAIAAVLLAASLQSHAQEPASGEKSLAATMDVYVFPNNGQAPSQQSKDEGTCYQWAVSNVGTDPFKVQKQQAEQQKQAVAATEEAAQAGAGSGARGAVGGAAAGALIGEIADDHAGSGAAWGAAIGGIAARRRARRAEIDQTAAIQADTQQSQQASAEQIGNFKKAFSVCLEAKKYMVKY